MPTILIPVLQSCADWRGHSAKRGGFAGTSRVRFVANRDKEQKQIPRGNDRKKNNCENTWAGGRSGLEFAGYGKGGSAGKFGGVDGGNGWGFGGVGKEMPGVGTLEGYRLRPTSMR